MLCVGEERVVQDGRPEQGDLQSAEDRLDDVREVRCGKDGVKDQRECVERDGSGFAERQVEIPCVDGVQRLLRGRRVVWLRSHGGGNLLLLERIEPFHQVIQHGQRRGTQGCVTQNRASICRTRRNAALAGTLEQLVLQRGECVSRQCTSLRCGRWCDYTAAAALDGARRW